MTKKTYVITLQLVVKMDEDTANFYKEEPADIIEVLAETEQAILTIEETTIKQAQVEW